MNTAEKMKKILEESFQPTRLEIIDDSHKHRNHPEAKKSGGGHYTVKIASLRFEKMNRIQKHQAVYKALDELIPSEIHALSIELEN